MMKLLLENWRTYTKVLINEELLVENYEQAQQSVFKRATKLIKGWSYAHDKEKYDSIERQAATDSEKYWADDAVYSWEIGGKLLLAAIKQLLIPNDIDEVQKRVALFWVYNQLVEEKFYEIRLDALLQVTFNFISNMYDEGETSISNEEFDSSFDPETSEKASTIEDYMYKIEPLQIQWMSTPSGIWEPDGRDFQLRKVLIERFFQMNRFIRDGKRDLNAVQDFSELSFLIQDARPMYQEWKDKQVDKSAELGKEVLLDNQDWQVIAIHNKGAACELGKGTDWCTAAPGLEYFKQYYKPNDPLFYIFDKSINEKFQFHFGSQQFMDSYDIDLSPSRALVEREIMRVLAKVVPQKYDIAYRWLSKYK